MANITKKQQQEIDANNSIKHFLEVGRTYVLILKKLAKSEDGKIEFVSYTKRAVYVGNDKKDYNGFMMAMFQLADEKPVINGFRYNTLADMNPILVK